MSYTSTSAVERIGTCSIVGLSGMRVRLRHDRCPEVVEVWRAYRRRAELVGRLARHTARLAPRLPRETRTDRLAQRLDDDLFLAGLHRLGVDDDAVRRSARAGRFEEEDARVVLLQRHHQLVRVDAGLGSEHQLDARNRVLATIVQVAGGDAGEVVQPLQHPLGLGPPQRRVCVVVALHVVFERHDQADDVFLRGLGRPADAVVRAAIHAAPRGSGRLARPGCPTTAAPSGPCRR